MEYRKNDLVTLKIEDCGVDGEGIGESRWLHRFCKGCCDRGYSKGKGLSKLRRIMVMEG